MTREERSRLMEGNQVKSIEDGQIGKVVGFKGVCPIVRWPDDYADTQITLAHINKFEVV